MTTDAQTLREIADRGRKVNEAWEILDAHVENRRAMGQFQMAAQMEEALIVIREALAASQEQRRG